MKNKIAQVLAYSPPSVNDESNIKPVDPNNMRLIDIGGKAIDVLLLLCGIAAVIVVIWSGISYITAGGDSSKADKAKKMLIYAVLGVMLITGAAWIKAAIIEATQIDSTVETRGSF